jgi:hypothetical protein
LSERTGCKSKIVRVNSSPPFCHAKVRLSIKGRIDLSKIKKPGLILEEFLLALDLRVKVSKPSVVGPARAAYV